MGLLWAIGSGVDSLQKRDADRLAMVDAQHKVQDQRLAAGATGTSRLTTETERIAASLYRYASLPFEIASILLLVAIIGSVMLARTLKQEASADDVAPEVLQEALIDNPKELA